MIVSFPYARLQILVTAFACIRLQADDFFVAPDGTPIGPGTLSQPYDLATTLAGQVGQPGDTFWLRGGNYSLGHLDTTLHGAPGQPLTFRQVSGENARVDGSLGIFNSVGYVVFRDFELYSSDTNRASSQTGVGFNVTDISIIPGIACYAPNLYFINLVVHDQTRHGIYTSEHATNILVYGCLLFNNGWVSPDNAEGHGIYAQGMIGTRTITDNITFNNSGANMHIYENTTNRSLVGVILEGNVAFNAGAIQNVRSYRDWIVGVDFPGVYADDIVLKNNMSFRLPDLSTQTEAQIGRDSINGSVTLTDNYMPLGLLMNNWQDMIVSRNVFAPRLMSSYVAALDQTLTTGNADWDNNTYVCPLNGNEFSLNSAPCSFSVWQETTGFDQNSTFVVGNLHGTRIFVRSNIYEPGRANIIVYNWDDLDNVTVDVSSVLPVGSGFEVSNAQDFHAAPVLNGVYNGHPIRLPMTNLTVASPNGPLLTAPPTGPTFNVFVLRPRKNKVQVRRLGAIVQIYWPISSGVTALQFNSDLAVSGNWASSTSNPVVVGDQFMIPELGSTSARFYRLRTQ